MQRGHIIRRKSNEPMERLIQTHLINTQQSPPVEDGSRTIIYSQFLLISCCKTADITVAYGGTQKLGCFIDRTSSRQSSLF